jgi:glycosyltransferase involved in cell wall biosynthesis
MDTRVTLIHPSDPLSGKVGGAERFIKDFIKHAPDDFSVEQVGVTSSPDQRPVGRWTSISIGDRQFRLRPVLHEKEVDRKTRIPLALRFIHGLLRNWIDLSDRVLLFNRIEPAVLFGHPRYRTIGFVHTDIEKRIAEGSEDNWRHFPWLYYLFERRVFRSLNHVFTVSRQSLSFYEQRYPFLNGSLSFLPTWSDPTVFHPTTEPVEDLRRRLAAAHGIPTEVIWVLYAGRLLEQKAPLRLVESFGRFRSRRADAVFLVVGDGNLKGRMANKADELGLSSAVFFLGSKSPDCLAEFYRASDVLLLTSNFEGMPRSCLEALGSGLPVVSTDVGEVRLVVRNGFSGEVLEKPHPEAIASAIETVVSNRSRYTRDNCLQAVAEFTPENVLRPVYELCRGWSSGSSTGDPTTRGPSRITTSL